MSTLIGPEGEHDWHSQSYVADWIGSDATRDDARRPLLRRVAVLIPATRGDQLRVLDVGGGYGALSAEVLEYWPDAQVTLLDYSDAMITEAGQRLAAYGPRVTYQVADVTEAGWSSGLEKSFDAVVSAYAIHDAGDAEVIRDVYRSLITVLRPGGTLLNYDLMFPVPPSLAELYRRDPTRNLGWDARMSQADLRLHLDGLRDAGFEDVECIWKDLEQGIVWARCPA
jgi:tRNA (cmo5U34)-methyltransferase